MKKSIILFGVWVLLIPTLLFSQKFDNVWVMGYNWDSDPEAETYRLNFDTFPPYQLNYFGFPKIDRGYAGISDSAGNLQLYTNNCSISDKTGELIPGGDSMAVGWELDWCQAYGWHPYSMYSIFLPAPDSSHKIYLFYKSSYKSSSGPLVVYANKLKYAIVDMSKNDGLGAVTVKNKNILNDRFGYGQITAVKHGNGRDWWLPMPVEIGNKIFMILLSKDSVYRYREQNIGPSWGDSGGFQASFSPDGSMYARYNRFQGLYLYDFDRCDGTLSNVRYFPYTTTTQGLQGGVGFSPDNRLLYFADYDSLYQLDLKSSNIDATKKLVAVYDGNISTLWTRFSFIVPGPDGRIYVIPPAFTTSMHVINRPNLTGMDCNVQQHFIEFPNPYGNPPNHPNYRLGPLDGSPCDTLGIDNHPLADFRPDPSDTNHLAIQFWDVSSYEPAECLWDFGDGSPASQDTSPVHIFPAPGFYTVCLTVGNPYGVSSKCKVVEVKVSGVGEVDGTGRIVLYPNPTTGLVTVFGLDATSCQADLFNITGQKVTSVQLLDNTIDLSSLSSGVYFIRLTDPKRGQLGISKVVISK